MKEKTILKTHKKVNTIETDVAVVGGGLSGIITALTCASNGLKTLLVEKYGFVGGLIATSFGYPLRVFTFQRNFSELLISDEQGEHPEIIQFPIFSTFIKYLLKNQAIPENLLPDPLKISGAIIPFDFEKFKFTLLELLIDFNVDCLFHASFVRANLQGDKVKSIYVFGKEGLIEIKARYFVDATGNCNLFNSIDESFTVQVESYATYNFVLNNCNFEAKDDQIICEVVESENFERGVYHAYVINIDDLKLAVYELPLKNHSLVFGGERIQIEPNDVVSISKAEENLQLKIYSLLEKLKKFKPFEKSRISMFPAQVYFTESRRLNSLYTLTSKDVFEDKSFTDEICIVKISVIGEKIFPCFVRPVKKFDNMIIRIPFSSFITKIKNLVVVGRGAGLSEDLKFVLYSFPFVMKSSENIGKIISFAFKNEIDLTEFKPKVKFEWS
ncbi:FAD-dependent oxidoreductase [Candidatus Chrysopegis kryptomonas]|uniref:FAD dependent oxidoreductase n=1 Tax=Candidatus Chryseopegocella kryptomonas TaxID=1633643 RepID=A0A0P1MZF1_9BACT|nr:FAD-dependent oxidoreductase [Candidatus Chrysopegis kryptomonas]CUT01167.1 FAD dependent oxidoreductase [Candidatus Chrysopegis kryptomonas]